MDTRRYKPTGAGTRIYLAKTVVEAALERIDRLFDEFDNVVVRVSGGKDSTVVLNLALKVATERRRLPLSVFWLDQEAEWQSTVETVRATMYRDDVNPIWLQVPFRLAHAVSRDEAFLHCWDPEREADWMHPKDPIAIHENTYQEDRFAKMFGAHLRHDFPDAPACSIGGVRCEESPNRRKGLTSFATYKDITWGAKEDPRRGHYAFYPIYDWSYTDVWKAIHEGGWDYNVLYDTQYRYGIDVSKMRVSALMHETSVRSLFFLQEFEPETYERMVRRIGGIDTAGKLGFADFFVKDLPFMFADWREYRDYLLENLIDPPSQPPMRRMFAEHDCKVPEHLLEDAWRVHVQSIVCHDREGTKVKNWLQSPLVWQAVRGNKSNWSDAWQALPMH